jgi:hypothetical protein
MNNENLSVRRNFLAKAMGIGTVAAVGVAALQSAHAQSSGAVCEVVTNYAALRAYVGTATTVLVHGAASAGDGGSGTFRKVSGSTYIDNAGTVITPSGGSDSVAWLRLYSGEINARWFGANPSLTNNQPAIQAALNAANNAGEVHLPPGDYKITSPLSIPRGVSLTGAGGMASQITANGCDAIRFTFTTGFGNCILRGLYLVGMNPISVQHGINAPGTNNTADELYGITIENCLIRYFSVGIHFRSVRNFTLVNNWIENVEVGLDVTGRNLVGYIAFNKVVYGAGYSYGSGATPTGILLDSHPFTAGEVGNIPNEGIQLLCNQFYGFQNGISALHSRFVNITMNDVQARVNGVIFKDVELSLNIKDNYIELAGGAAQFALKGMGPGYSLATQVNIEGNSLLAHSSVGCTGIQINDPATTSQDHVRIVRNVIQGMNGYDILVNNPGPCTVDNNRCLSTSVTKSIKIGALVLKPVFVSRNFCQKTIELPSADVTAGSVRANDNIINGTTWL